MIRDFAGVFVRTIARVAGVVSVSATAYLIGREVGKYQATIKENEG